MIQVAHSANIEALSFSVNFGESSDISVQREQLILKSI